MLAVHSFPLQNVEFYLLNPYTHEDPDISCLGKRRSKNSVNSKLGAPQEIVPFAVCDLGRRGLACAFARSIIVFPYITSLGTVDVEYQYHSITFYINSIQFMENI